MIRLIHLLATSNNSKRVINIANLYSMNRRSSESLNKSSCCNGVAVIELNCTQIVTNYMVQPLAKEIKKNEERKNEDHNRKNTLLGRTAATTTTKKIVNVLQTSHTLHAAPAVFIFSVITCLTFDRTSSNPFVCDIAYKCIGKKKIVFHTCFVCFCWRWCGVCIVNGAIAVFSVNVHRIISVCIALQLLLSVRA